MFLPTARPSQTMSPSMSPSASESVFTVVRDGNNVPRQYGQGGDTELHVEVFHSLSGGLVEA